MHILLAAAAHPIYCQALNEVLRHGGMQEAASTTRTEYRPEEVSARLKKVRAGQRAPSDSKPSRAWTTIGSEIVIKNADKDIWGWVHWDNLGTSSFWRELSGEATSVILVDAPAAYIARTMMAPTAVRNYSATDALEEWLDFHGELVGLLPTLPNDSILLTADSLLFANRALAAVIEPATGLDFAGNGTPSQTLPPADAFDAAMASRLVDEVAPEAGAIYEKILSHLTHRDDLSLAASSGAVEQAELYFARRHLLPVGDAKTEDFDVPEFSDNTLCADVIDAGDKNLLRLQLAEAEEELRYYFQKYQEAIGTAAPMGNSSGSSNDAFESKSAATNRVGDLIVLDVRDYVDGSGWHNPEEDGRWAGPSKVSTITLPDLASGRYRIDLHVVDAIAPDVFSGMKISLDNEALTGVTSRCSAPQNGGKGLRDRIRRVRAEMSAAFPRIVSAKFELKQDTKRPELSLEFPKTISPSSSGSSDTRELSVRVRDIRIRSL